MKIKRIIMPFFAVVLMLAGLTAAKAVFADEDMDPGDGNEMGEGREGFEWGKGREGLKMGERGMHIVPENPTYRLECSSCHTLYPPGLLPERSWRKLLKGVTHFGELLDIDDYSMKEIQSYLISNSAERSGAEWARKIMDSLTPFETPSTITQVGYIERKHRKIRRDVFKRPSIGSFSNCGACHPKAEQGDFEENAVKIPD